MRYVYTVARFVPDTARNEGINVGILVGSDATGEWSLQTTGQFGRARRMDALDVFPGVLARLAALGEQLADYSDAAERLLAADGLATVSETWLSKMVSQARGLLQWTEPAVVTAETANEAIGRLWEHLILESDRGPRREAVTKHRVLGEVYQALRQWHLQGKVWQRPVLEAGRSKTAVDFAVHDGIVRHMTNCWSFQVADKDGLINEATRWAWSVRDVRRSGGQLSLGGESAAVNSDVDIAVVFVPPATGDPEGSAALEQVRAVFADHDVRIEAVVPLSETASVATRVAELVGP